MILRLATAALLSFRRPRLREERGISLVISLLVVSSLTITTAGLVTLVSSNDRAFGRDRQEALAFNTGEAGLNYAISTLAKTGDPNGDAAVGSVYPASGSISFSDSAGSGTWWAQKTAVHTWTIWATGTSPTGAVTRKVSVQAHSVTQPGTITPASAAWTYGLFVANPGPSCFSPGGTADVTISVYVNGCISLSGNIGIAEPATSTAPSIEVYAATTISLTGSASIGTSVKPVLKVTAPGGCTGKGGKICSQPGSNVYATQYNGPAQNLTKPALYPDVEYARGDWDNPSCSVGSFTFDDDATRNTSVSSPNLFPTASYDCTVYNPAGTSVVGRLAWNATTKILTATGWIYIDGNLNIGSDTTASYSTGTTATIYVDGTVTTNGGSTLCGPPSLPSGSTCTGVWNGTLGALVIAAVNHNNVTPAWKMNGNAEYNVAAYIVGQYSTSGTASVTGPVITDTVTVQGNAESTDLDNPPPSAPGAGGTSPGATSWGVIPGTWRQLLN